MTNIVEETIESILLELPSSAYPEVTVRLIITAFLSALPRPSLPYDQAIAYRKLVGMDNV